MPGNQASANNKVVEGRLNVDSSGDDEYDSGEGLGDDNFVMSAQEDPHAKKAVQGSRLEHLQLKGSSNNGGQIITS